MSGIVNTIVKNHFEVDLNFHPIRVIRFRNSDPVTIMFNFLFDEKIMTKASKYTFFIVQNNFIF